MWSIYNYYVILFVLEYFSCNSSQSILLLCLVLSCTLAAKLKWFELDSTYKFETYLEHYGKSYGASEYQMRKAIFEANLNKILTHNKDTTKTWKEEINHLADWTAEV